MKRWILHPFLFALFPVFSLLLNNLTILTPVSLIRSLLVLELVALVLWAGLRWFFRNSQAAAVAVSALLFVFFINKSWGDWGMLALWGILFAGLLILGRRRPGRLAGLSPVLNVMALVLLLLQIGQYAQAVRKVEMTPVPVPFAAKPDPKTLPHIIHIVADEFGRPDIIKKQYGCDLEFLVNCLRTNGFFVAERARSNYMQTMQCFASELAMQYLPGSLPETSGMRRLSRSQLSRSFTQSAAVRTLSKLGYRCQVTVTDGSTLTEWATGGNPDEILNLSERVLLTKSCLRPLEASLPDPSLQDQLYAHYRRTQDMLLHEADCVRLPDPVFKVIHIVSPHSPYVFTTDGQYRMTKCFSEYIFSADAARGPAQDPWRYQWDEYAEQIQYISGELCKMVERAIRESARPVVIILQGDHGPATERDGPFLEGRSGILLAIRLPGMTPVMPPEAQSPVNVYRHIFRELWKADLPLLPTRIFKSEWESPDLFDDVTEQVATQRCTWTLTRNVEYDQVKTFVRATASPAVETHSEGWAVIDNIRHCPWNPSAVPGGTITADRAAADAAAMCDADMSTAWGTALTTGETAHVSISFAEPTALCGLRLISLSKEWPGIREMRVVTEQGEESVLTNWVPAGFFWSGPHLYQRDLKSEEEVLFEPRKVRRLEVDFFAVSKNERVMLNELECLAPAPEPWPEDWQEEEIYQEVRRLGARRLVAPRWLERYAYEQSGHRLAVTLPVAYYRQSACHYWKDASSALTPLDLTRDTVLVGYRTDATNSAAAFMRAGVAPHTRAVGPYVLYWFDDSNWKEEYRFCGKLYGAEGGFRFGNVDEMKIKARARFFHEQALKPGIPVPQQIEWLARCVEAYPDYQPAWLQLSVLQRQAGNEQAAQAARREWQKRTVPTIRCEASFEQGATLLGYQLETNRMTAGTSSRLTCFWLIPAALDPATLAVFMHFGQGKRLFQGDREFLDNTPRHVTQDQPFQEVFRQEMPFDVPADALSGPYEITLGLYNRESGKRLKVDSEYEGRKRSLKLPTNLTVEVAPSS